MKMLVLPLTVVLSLCLVSAQAQEDAAKKEFAKLQGTWKRVAAEVDGKKVPAAELQTSTLTVDGDKYMLNMAGQMRTGVFKLDPSKTPKQIDIVSDAGPNKGKSLPGIYELDGDVFKYVVSSPGKERPTDFTAKPGHALYVNKRVAP
jgi:uncharacterized protein (TIGR03067 family)